MDEKIDFEEKIKIANDLLKKLTNPDIALQDSVKVYKEGIEQLEIAQKILDEAKMQYQEISK